MNRWSLVFRMLFGSLLLLLAACGGGPSTITVSGRVIDVLGQGVGGLKVRIGSTTVTTAPSGSFSISGVTTPYDAVVFDTSVKVALYYKGLTRSDPNLTAFDLSSLPAIPPLATPNSATFSSLPGNISGVAGGPNNRIRVFFDSPETLGSFNDLTGNPGTYSLSAAWLNSTFSTTGKVHALEWDHTGPPDFLPNPPNPYKGYASANASISIFGSPAPNLTLNPALILGTTTLTPTVNTQPGYAESNPGRRVKLRIGSGPGTLLIGDSLAGGLAANYLIPSISGATVSLEARANSGSNLAYAWITNLATNTNTNPTINLPAAPSLTASATTNVTTSTVFTANFTGTGFSGGVNVFYFNGPVGSPDISVITTANTTTIPDLSGIGLGLPTTGTVSYSWRVLGVAPFDTTNAAAGPGGFLRDFARAADPNNNAAPNADGSAVVSATNTFTTP